MILRSDEGRTTIKMAIMKSAMARMEGSTMNTKNRFCLSWDMLIKIFDFKKMTICIKYTKTAAAMITRHRRNPHNNWKIFKTKFSVAIIFEAFGI